MEDYVVGAKFVITQNITVKANSRAEAKSLAIRKLLGEAGWNTKLEETLNGVGLELECTVVNQLWDVEKVPEGKESDNASKRSASKTPSKAVRRSGKARARAISS